MIFLVILAMVGARYQRLERLRNSGIAEIDKMSGAEFENYLGQLFRILGYRVEVTQTSGDYGADLILTKEGNRIVVQAKRYSKNVGLKAVQEVQSARAHYAAAEAWVITNSNFTGQAVVLAQSNGVKLISREELISLCVHNEKGHRTIRTLVS